jgi:hypothetical protein
LDLFYNYIRQTRGNASVWQLLSGNGTMGWDFIDLHPSLALAQDSMNAIVVMSKASLPALVAVDSCFAVVFLERLRWVRLR